MWPIACEGVVYHTQGGVVTPCEGYGGQNPYEGQLSQHKGYGRLHRSDALIECVLYIKNEVSSGGLINFFYILPFSFSYINKIKDIV